MITRDCKTRYDVMHGTYDNKENMSDAIIYFWLFWLSYTMASIIGAILAVYLVVLFVRTYERFSLVKRKKKRTDVDK